MPVSFTGSITAGSATASFSGVTVDTLAPNAPKINAIATDNLINTAEKDAGVTVTGTAEAGSTITLTTSSGYTATATTSGTTGTGNWSITIAKADIESFGQGAETITVVARDAAGNVSTPTSRTVTVDTTGPAKPTFALVTDTGSDSTDGISSQGIIKVNGLEPGAKWEYTTNGTAGTPTWINGTGSTFTLAAGTYANGAVLVRQTDAAGNVATSEIGRAHV